MQVLSRCCVGSMMTTLSPCAAGMLASFACSCWDQYARLAQCDDAAVAPPATPSLVWNEHALDSFNGCDSTMLVLAVNSMLTYLCSVRGLSLHAMLWGQFFRSGRNSPVNWAMPRLVLRSLGGLSEFSLRPAPAWRLNARFSGNLGGATVFSGPNVWVGVGTLIRLPDGAVACLHWRERVARERAVDRSEALQSCRDLNREGPGACMNPLSDCRSVAM